MLIRRWERTGRGTSEGGGTMTVDVLENFSVADHDRVRAVARARELQPGDCLFDQGSVATAAFLVTGGSAAVLAQGRPVGEIGAGDVLGDADVLGRRHLPRPGRGAHAR